VEILRRQIEDLKPCVGKDATALDTRLIELEEDLHRLRTTDRLKQEGVPAIIVKAVL
jgi:hypothetical protein